MKMSYALNSEGKYDHDTSIPSEMSEFMDILNAYNIPYEISWYTAGSCATIDSKENVLLLPSPLSHPITSDISPLSITTLAEAGTLRPLFKTIVLLPLTKLFEAAVRSLLNTPCIESPTYYHQLPLPLLAQPHLTPEQNVSDESVIEGDAQFGI